MLGASTGSGRPRYRSVGAAGGTTGGAELPRSNWGAELGLALKGGDDNE